MVYVSGGKYDKLYVALCEAETGKELTRVTGTGTNELKKSVSAAPVPWVRQRSCVSSTRRPAPGDISTLAVSTRIRWHPTATELTIT